MSEQRLRAVEAVAQGFIDAVRDRDKVWIRQVVQSVEAGRIDMAALLVSLAGAACDE